MYKLTDVEETVTEFLKKEFPEILSDVESSGVASEIAVVIFDMLTGDDDDE
jgi:hypothetical protein